MVASQYVQSNFSGGLKTEFTGLNFPENSCTAISNCIISLIGEIERREGINFETNYALNSITTTNKAINYYLWKNVGGDGQTQVLVVQVGSTLYFFEISNATVASPISTTLLASTVTLTAITGDPSQTEAQFSDGNGYLFVYHSMCDPFYCTFASGTVTSNTISVQVRDFAGLFESGVPVNFRPAVLTTEHNYNLINQGWISGAAWTATSTTNVGLTSGHVTFTVASGISNIATGQIVVINSAHAASQSGAGGGTVFSYTASTLVINVTYFSSGSTASSWTITENNQGYINTWSSTFSNFPSNADIWYEFKDSNGQFTTSTLATTALYVSQGFGQAPQGHFVMSAWDLDRSLASGLSGITVVSTNKRPRTGIFWAGRTWYAGVDDSQAATGDAIFSTWTENIYFSQVITSPSNIGNCYQVNDPTDETLNALLPTDGGVIVIQGSGGIHKLFALQNGLLVFATNGIWLISGQGGLGFTANSYSINKISSVQVLTSHSFVDVLGEPIFWNEEGIYTVSPNQDASPYQFAGFKVEPITKGTIQTFYDAIPKDSKRYARGTYNPIKYTIKWSYRTTQEAGISNRYQMDGVLVLNTHNKAFYPYQIASNGASFVAGPQFVYYTSSLNTPNPVTKYLTIVNNTSITFAEENDATTWFDWFSYDNVGVSYTSSFTTGYNLHGKGLLKWSNNYIYMYADNAVPYAYKINGIWDYSASGDSGRQSNVQQITNFNPNFAKQFRRHKIRGHGMSLQLNVSSVSGQPFQFFGWSMADDIDAGV